MKVLEIPERIQYYKPSAATPEEPSTPQFTLVEDARFRRSSRVRSTGLLRTETDSALDSRSALSLVVTSLTTVQSTPYGVEGA
jgi:hypothetical protein